MRSAGGKVYFVDSELTFHIIIQEPLRFFYDTLNGCWFLAYVAEWVRLNIITNVYLSCSLQNHKLPAKVIMLEKEGY